MYGDLLQKWYFAQAGAVDERVHHFPFPEEVMGRLVRYLVSHEVGHTLDYDIIFIVAVLILSNRSGIRIT